MIVAVIAAFAAGPRASTANVYADLRTPADSLSFGIQSRSLATKEHVADEYAQGDSAYTGLSKEEIVQKLRCASTCQNILEVEAADIFKVYAELKNLPPRDKAHRLRAAKEFLGSFLSEAYQAVSDSLNTNGQYIDTRNLANIEKVQAEISHAIWKRFKHAETANGLAASELRLSKQPILEVVRFLFDSVDPEGRQFLTLDCKTSSYLTAELLKALGVGEVELASAKGHALVCVRTKEQEVYLETTVDPTSQGFDLSNYVYNSYEALLAAHPEYEICNTTYFVSRNTVTLQAQGSLYFKVENYERALSLYYEALDPYVTIMDDYNCWFNIAACYRMLRQKENFYKAMLRLEFGASPNEIMSGPYLRELDHYTLPKEYWDYFDRCYKDGLPS